MHQARIDEIIQGFMDLPATDKEYVAEIIEKQLVEARREQIARRAKQAMAHYRRGNVERGTVKELYQDLESG